MIDLIQYLLALALDLCPVQYVLLGEVIGCVTS